MTLSVIVSSEFHDTKFNNIIWVPSHKSDLWERGICSHFLYVDSVPRIQRSKRRKKKKKEEEDKNSISYLLCCSEILLIYNNNLGSYSPELL